MLLGFNNQMQNVLDQQCYSLFQRAFNIPVLNPLDIDPSVFKLS